MTDAPGRLVWIDLEMTGLDCMADSIIEIATIVTDGDLNVIAEGPVLAIHQPETVLSRMDDWNVRQHGRSGLLDRVRQSRVTAAEAERIFERFYRMPGSRLDGSGLGLSIVREIAHGLGARCGYRSREGGGACFYVRFPKAAAT